METALEIPPRASIDTPKLVPASGQAIQFDLVSVTPAPRLSRLERAHNRMCRLMEMLGRMLVGRRIAATHVTALQAQAKVYPATARLQTLFTTLRSAGCHLSNLIEMRTNFHDCSPFTLGG